MASLVRFALRRAPPSALRALPCVRPLAVRRFSGAPKVDVEANTARFEGVHDHLTKSFTAEETALMNKLLELRNSNDSVGFDNQALDAPKEFVAKVRNALKDELARIQVAPVPEVPPSPLAKLAEERLAAGDVKHAYGLHPAAGAIGKPGVLDKYAVATTIAFAGVIAISKEFLILNEELLCVGAVLGVLATAWVAKGDEVAATYNADRFQTRLDVERTLDLNAEILRTHLAALRANLNHVEDKRQLLKHYENTYFAWHKAQVQSLRKRIDENTEKALERALDAEEAELDTFVDQSNESANQFVEAEFKKNPQLRAAFFKASLEAVAAIGEGKGRTSVDPLNSVYEQFFNSTGDRLKKMKTTFDELAPKIVKMSDAEFAAELKKHDPSVHNILNQLRKQRTVQPFIGSFEYMIDKMSPEDQAAARKYWAPKQRPEPIPVQWRPHGLL